MVGAASSRRAKKLNAELANGRLAMFAIIGMPLGALFSFACAGTGLLVRRGVGWCGVVDLEQLSHGPRFFQDGLTGSAWGDWALFTDSPLRNSGCIG